ncbi:MAG TPA: tetratricopeptide repeat protein [Terriglobia bacterium]|nr:tetratricopeptide repeat protein [Terriglobia bacterium]
MFAGLRRSLLLGAFSLFVAASAWAQTTTLQGDVKGPDGQPLKGALIVLDRTDIKGHYQVKTDKHGHWLYTGLPSGTFDISCVVNGKVMDKVTHVHSGYGDNPPVNFDLHQEAQQQAAAQQANASGQMTQEQARGMSKEQKEAYEAQLKKNADQIKKNKALNDTYNAAKQASDAAAADTDPAKKATDYQTAIDNYKKAADIDANQIAIWAGLGDAYYGLGQTQKGDDRTKSFDSAIEAYQKVLAINPNEAAIYNQIGNIYGAEKKIPEATEALTKAAQLDPTMAAKAYYNMGANLVNSGNSDQAADFFKKAIDADPNYADAHYQYGICLMAKAQVDAKTGKITPPPGTAEQFQKYLELKPDGPNAQSSKEMLASLGETVETKYSNPAAKKKR